MSNLPIFCHQDHHCFRLRKVDFLLPLLQIKSALSKMGLLFFTAFLALAELPHPWSWESSKVKLLFYLVHALVYSVKSGVSLSIALRCFFFSFYCAFWPHSPLRPILKIFKNFPMWDDIFLHPSHHSRSPISVKTCTDFSLQAILPFI